MAAGDYTIVGARQTVATAITILELTAPSTAVLAVYRAWVFNLTTTVGAFGWQIIRKSATITGTASPPTPRPTLPGYAASGMTTKWLATAEGTDGVTLWESGGRNDGGESLWVATREGEIFYVPPSGIIAIKFPAAPASGSYTFGFACREIG